MTHLFSNLQGHLSGAFRPGLVPGNAAIVPSELLNADVTFATSTGWSFPTPGGEWDIPISGRARGTFVGTSDILSCPLVSPLVVGRSYRLTVTAVSLTETFGLGLFAGFDYSTTVFFNGVGAGSYDFTVTTAGASTFEMTIASGDIFTIDNISLTDVT